MRLHLTLLGLMFLSVNAFAAGVNKGGVHHCGGLILGSCNTGAPLTCVQGWVDGCVNGTTNNHECVEVNEGVSCSIPATIECPENFADGCTIGESTVHACRAIEGASCNVPTTLVCPENYSDDCLQ